MKSAWITAGLLVWAVHGNAAPQGGVDGGGGGKSVVCRNSKGQITSAQTLDLFEAKNVYNLKLTSYDGTVEEISQKIQAKLKATISTDEYDYGSIYKRVNKIMKWVPPSVVIKPIDDAAEVVLPKNCQLEQLAHYIDDETLVVSQEIWNHLSNTEKAALISHEAIYRVDRAFGAKDSRRARRIVGHLFSDFTFEKTLEGVPATAKSCTAKQGERMTYKFYYFPSEDGKSTKMQFQWYDGKPVISKKTATFPMALPWVKNLPIRCQGKADCKVSEGVLDSKFEGVGALKVARGSFKEKDDSQAKELFYFDTESGRQILNCSPGADDNLVAVSIPKSSGYVIPATTASCYATKVAHENGTVPVMDISEGYFAIQKLTFKQTNPLVPLLIVAVKIYVTNAEGNEVMCAYGGDQLAALQSQWWYRSDKVAVVPEGASQFSTDCAIKCGGFGGDPFTGTGFVKVYGYQDNEETGEQQGIVVSTPITITNF